jgi:hypothetical protein
MAASVLPQWFTGDYVSERQAYDVFPDGSFLMLEDDVPAVAPYLEVVANWPSLRGLAKD